MYGLMIICEDCLSMTAGVCWRHQPHVFEVGSTTVNIDVGITFEATTRR